MIELATGVNDASEPELKSSRRGWYFPVGGGARAADVSELTEHAIGADDMELTSSRRGWFFPIGGRR